MSTVIFPKTAPILGGAWGGLEGEIGFFSIGIITPLKNNQSFSFVRTRQWLRSSKVATSEHPDELWEFSG